jgi:hypothetical protein
LGGHHPPSEEVSSLAESVPCAYATSSEPDRVYYGDCCSGQFQVQVQASDERSGLERHMTTNKED